MFYIVIRRGVKLKKNSIKKLAYLAGIVDGEGCIALNKVKRKENYQYDYYMGILTVVNTDKRLIDWLLQNFGGNFHTIKREPPHKTSYHWHASALATYGILKEILPYLYLKREQAEILMQFRKTVMGSGKHVGERTNRLRKKLSKQMCKLNKRGVAV